MKNPKKCKVCGCNLTKAMKIKWYDVCSRNCYGDWYGDHGEE